VTTGLDATAADLDTARELARTLRIDSLRATAAASAGHPTSAASAAEVMAVLGALHFRLDVGDPKHPGNDRFILSKGHASALQYAWLKAFGAIDDAELLTYGQVGSRLEGHPRPLLPWVEVATGSLGQGITNGVGIALSLKRLEHSPARVYVLCGDSEMAEGSVWEAFEHAAHYDLDNLVVIVDVNALGQSGPTMVGPSAATFARRAQAFGWTAIEVDGHDVEQLDRAFRTAGTDGRPTAIIARTVKGKGLVAVEGLGGWHGRPHPDPAAALEALGAATVTRFPVRPPAEVAGVERLRRSVALPTYEVGSSVATRLAYGQALVALGDARDDVVVLDAETQNSTYAELFAAAHPERYFEMFIAEQQMVGAAVGLASRGWTAYVSTFASFTTRAFEFARMSAIGGAALRMCGSHAGLSVGESGASGMGLEDIACFRAIPGSRVLQPADATAAGALTALVADLPGFSYLRTTRAPVPVLYPSGTEFVVGGSHVLRSGDDDVVTVVASGATVFAALAAHDLLADQGVAVRVVDAYSVKPVDAATVLAAAARTPLVVTVEDHYPEGGLGSAVAEVLAEAGSPARLVRLAVSDVPGSGPSSAIAGVVGIDAAGVVRTVLAALQRTTE
jgi:transketolase